MSIAMRLGLGFGLVVLLSLLLSLFQLYSFRSTISFLDTVTQRDFRAYSLVVGIAHGRAELRGMRQLAIIRSVVEENGPNVTLEAYQRVSAEIINQMSELGALAHERLTDPLVSPERRAHWSRMAGSADEMVQLERAIQIKGEELIRLAQAHRVAEAARVHEGTLLEHQGLDQRQTAIEELVVQLVGAGRADVRHAYNDTMRVAVIAVALILLVGAGAASLIGGSIAGALRRFMGFVQIVGQGDLSQTLSEEGGGELARMGAHLNVMRQSMRQVVGRARLAAENVNAATTEIRASSQEQAAASAEQLSAIEETSATLTEITQSGAQITQRAQEVERNAQAAAILSGEGLKALVATVQAMDSIREQVDSVAATIVSLSERTQAIGEIILTVTTIAERSHLLALNASIEAAAAGEHGRTFSVVAGEIKRLADQARDATQRVRMNLGEIQQGINSSVMLAEEAAKRVESGRLQTRSTDSAIRDMAGAIQESVQAFQQIVAATNQHQIGLEQVMQALASVRQAASQTSQATRELEGAAGNLNSLSEGLLDAFRNYRL
jgi:methyl-accepting chemotaxis protein